MAVVPLTLTSFFFAFRKSFVRHKAVTRFAMPIWLYVSVTGVIIFFMLSSAAP
jgi:putative membrane protein